MAESTPLDLERQGARAAEALGALMAEATSLSLSLDAGTHGRRRAGVGETFWQYRDYAMGDPAHMIDWRQSARAPRRLFVRETEWETAATVRFWCRGGDGFDYSSGAQPTKKWRAMVMTLAMAIALNRGGEKIGLIADGMPARRGPRAVMGIADALIGQHDATESSEIGLPLPPPGTTHAVYISDFYQETDALLTRLKALAASGCRIHLVEVTDPAEETFPFTGRTIFQSPGDQKHRRLFGDADAVRHAYLAAREAHREALLATAQRYGFNLIRHRTDHGAMRALSALQFAISEGQV